MYNYVIIVTCVAFQNGFMATQALGYIMFDIYIYIYIYIYNIYVYICTFWHKVRETFLALSEKEQTLALYWNL